jgi:chromosomal replication initiator protein
MAELPDSHPSPSCARSFCVRPGLAHQELVEALEDAVRCITSAPRGAAEPLARRALAALVRIQNDERLASISAQIARDFRLPRDDLLSRSREQRIAFVRQLAMFLSRKITTAPFEFIGDHFHRDHTTVVHACRLIERRMQRDAAFRIFIEKLEGRITQTIP